MSRAKPRRGRRRTDRSSDTDINLRSWDRWARSYEARHERSLARYGSRAWGIWRIPESRLRLIGNVRGKDALELGCGAGWWSIALARDGARPVGVDFSSRRLEQAHACSRRAGVRLPLVRARAERLPIADGAFDLVLSDYGATTFSDPTRAIPEAARVLRPGGLLVFAHASPFRTLTEDGRTGRLRRRLLREYFDLRELRTGSSVEYQLPYGEWVRLFSDSGLRVERLVEPPAPPDRGSSYVSPADLPWARRWPMEAIWRLRKEAVGRSPPAPSRRSRRGPRRSWARSRPRRR